MQFTLDSIEQFKNCLLEKHKGKSVTTNPIIIDDLLELTNNVQNTFYFGILTVATNVVNCKLFNENDNEIITIEANSQIIDYFSYCSFLNDADADLAAPKGHFRGFEVNIR